MSLYLVYFESKNSLSLNYDGFKDVGNYIFPKIFKPESSQIKFNEKNHKASIFGDGTCMSANNFFLKSGKNLQLELLKFIEQRLRNDCIIANLFGFIRNSDNSPIVKNLKTINLIDLENQFLVENFRDGSGFKIINK